jgi:hypothetical protein
LRDSEIIAREKAQALVSSETEGNAREKAALQRERLRLEEEKRFHEEKSEDFNKVICL